MWMYACECMCISVGCGSSLDEYSHGNLCWNLCPSVKAYGPSFIFSIAIMTSRQTLTPWVCGAPETTQVLPMNLPFPR